ncbi:hypothetical protein MJ563_20450 [Klebsiella pneumoniae]|nr:hypothetical protein MJ563_20450 [Klebsiella pneumoniae]
MQRRREAFAARRSAGAGKCALLFEPIFCKKLLAVPVHERPTTLVERKAVVLKRDDLTAELLGFVERVRSLCRCRRDSGYARIPSWKEEKENHRPVACSISSIGHYSSSSVGRWKQATDCLESRITLSRQSGEGRSPGQTDNDIWYLLGYCAEQAGDAQQAVRNITSLPAVYQR